MGKILVINSGSSSLKFALFDTAGPVDSGPGSSVHALVKGQFSGLGTDRYDVSMTRHKSGISAVSPGSAPDHHAAVASLLIWLERQGLLDDIVAVGHRVVHGGQHFHQATQLDEHKVALLEALTPLAPLHQPYSLAPIKILGERLPELVQIACFDTAFHAHQPLEAKQFALPYAMFDRGFQRYGFHGLSYDYITRRLPTIIPDFNHDARVVVAHLGNGASLCAIQAGTSLASTMGFTALEGLPMGTRCGSIDAGLVLHLIAQEGMTIDEVTTLLYKESGLLGLSGISSDMRALLNSDRPRAQQAVTHYCYRIAREIGSLSAALGGLDHIVFTAGIGEHAAPVREQVAAHCQWLGVDLDGEANQANQSCISSTTSRVGIWVIPTDEEQVIAEDCLTMYQKTLTH
ncbi:MULTISPECIES: acetate/propionate family kinase [unclassified Salinivibrio]|uniref:acetate/propionate family kinase n=1 Tax=unclassified Salinivibrio TaxID=2636825 RepID=UPI00084CCE33|nr:MULTISPECIES: acetate/propionate family kinase [unclassified Salinivibrio]ODQ01466.1 acetate kinase [Salinivibrio sp. DV]PCE65332.1 acetate kinase [Salinivibrio sp. YCSC6]QCF37634.1 acetate/propionate family kinase [Salinivibrio sp. YCSC6]